MQSGVSLLAWKTAIVRSIPKRYPPREAGDLRPISILALSWIKLIVTSPGTTYWSGFRNRHSTHTALVKIVEDVREAIDVGEIVLAAAVDLTQAFDRVDTNVLVKKLAALGFSDSAYATL